MDFKLNSIQFPSRIKENWYYYGKYYKETEICSS